MARPLRAEQVQTPHAPVGPLWSHINYIIWLFLQWLLFPQLTFFFFPLSAIWATDHFTTLMFISNLSLFCLGCVSPPVLWDFLVWSHLFHRDKAFVFQMDEGQGADLKALQWALPGGHQGFHSLGVGTMRGCFRLGLSLAKQYLAGGQFLPSKTVHLGYFL